MTRSQRYRKYRREVAAVTKQSKTLLGPSRYGFTLDHVVPVSYGFSHDISPLLVGSLENLEQVPFQDNLAKGASLNDPARALLRKWGYDHLAEASEMRSAA